MRTSGNLPVVEEGAQQSVGGQVTVNSNEYHNIKLCLFTLVIELENVSTFTNSTRIYYSVNRTEVSA